MTLSMHIQPTRGGVAPWFVVLDGLSLKENVQIDDYSDLVYAIYALLSKGLHQGVHRPFELVMLGGLKTDFDCIERMPRRDLDQSGCTSDRWVRYSPSFQHLPNSGLGDA